ncbi:retrovirus-related pol polyprotein from transposon TNT 1-94 [Tanacetum coccineum]
MSTLNQQTLADSEANERPPMLERGNYIPWPMIPDPDGVVNLNGTMKEVLEPLSKMTEGNKKQYIADMKVMNYLLQAIPNDIYNSDGRVDIKNARYGGNGTKNAGKQCRNQVFNSGNGNHDNNQIIQRVLRTDSILGKSNVQCYNCNERGHYARDCQKPRVRDAKYFREQMLLAMKDEAGSNLTNKENDFLLDTSYGEETIEELTAAIMLMARIQPTNGNAETVPSYDVKAIIEVNASSKVHDQMRHEKHKTIIQTYNDDLIIFDDPYVENKGGTSDHDSNDHDEYHKIQTLAYDVQREAENQKRLNNELKKQKMLLQQELEMCYKNPERLNKGIAAQPKMYDAEKLHSTKLVLDSPDSEETLEDAKESRLKMRNKMVQINYAKLNALYEIFVP